MVFSSERPPEPGELFGAAITPGQFSPVPVVAIGGVDVASGAADPGTTLMVVDGFEVTWGRDDVLDQPKPSTGSLTLLDTSGTWATETDRRGQSITIRWEGTDPLEGPLDPFVFFRGRIGSPITLSRKAVYIDGRRVEATLIDLKLVSILVDLANITPTVAWPAETMGARLDRIIIECQNAGVLDNSATMRTFWSDPGVAPVAAKDQVSLLEHLTAIYDSSGADRFIYSPAADSATYLARRDYPQQRGMARLWWDGTDPARARHGQGAYIRSYSAVAGGVSGDPAYLDAATLEYEPGDGLTMPARITRVSITHPDLADAYNARTDEARVNVLPVTGGAINEELYGVRTASVDSLVAWNNYAATALSDLAEMVRKEGSAWVLQPLRLTTRRTGGFETLAAAFALISGFERSTLLFLQRSWLPQYGVRPIFGVMGGSIGYSDGGWDIEFSVAPITTTQPQHAITWEEIDDGSATYELQWWDPDDPDQTRSVHESVTYEDMAYVSTGLGDISTIPADTGWDR